ncbi:acyltransferase [Lysobacter sp. GCM10012299]|uniref:acyltransferase n=1 Tax=Lysobacter sp. GCM10012299 TaxID=3317333 RepID=UPI003623B384
MITWLIEIGDDVTLAPRVHVLAHDASTKRALGFTRIGRVRIGERVFVGAGSIILPGVSIGDDVIVRGGSFVTTDIPAGSVAVEILRGHIHDRAVSGQATSRDGFAPRFDAAYTLRGGVTAAMRREMNEAIESGFGYIE